MLNQKKILLGVSGGIAAYKACDLTSKLTQLGADVRVIMTRSATKFVSPLTFQALSRNPVYIDTFDEQDPKKVAHIDIADWTEIAIIAPATANIIGKMANGIADDMLSTTLLALGTRADVYIAPAMNGHMYHNLSVQENMKRLEKWGYHFIEPSAGYLACGYVGKGRLEEPQTIIDTITYHQEGSTLLKGTKILISAGPTREKIDPVRFLSNRSSGKMGYALAEAAALLGAEVTLVSGPVELSVTHPMVQRIDVTTAAEMYDAMLAQFPDHQIVIKAAAVADYRPKQTYDEKMKKQPGDLQINMERTKDILQTLGEQKKHQFIVGFAAETNNHIENGLKKLTNKHLDAIVVNNISSEGAGFGVDTNIVTFISKDHTFEELELAPKEEIAKRILQLIMHHMKDEDV